MIDKNRVADIYFLRTHEVLEAEGINPVVVMEVFTRHPSILCGLDEVIELLADVKGLEVWALREGDYIEPKEVILRIKGPYQSFGIMETQIIGILSHCTGWATAASECVEAAAGLPVTSFGARHIHPSVVGVMDYSAVLGGCSSCSSIAGAALAEVDPSGTMPHALMLVVGDTVDAAVMFDKHMPPEVPRIVLVDTFRDEAEESLRVADVLINKGSATSRLDGVRLDTPSERGGVTIELVREVRARLDLENFNHVKIYVSGGFTPDKIRSFIEAQAPVDGFGVGSHISGAKPIDFTADIHEVEGVAVAKRGRIPGLQNNLRLAKVLP